MYYLKLMQHLIFERHERGRGFARDFTISYLALLVSRILGASKRGMAAAVIQSSSGSEMQASKASS